MPTYQTTPYISWTFPDQAIAMNRKGVQPLQSTPLPQQDMVVGAQKYGWADDARKMALAGLETNVIKDKGMRGLLNTTARSQAFDRPSTLSQTRVNGRFMDPSYQYTQTPSGLRGGTGLLTKEGRAWAKRKLQQRVQELNAIDSQDYSAGPPSKVVILPELFKVDSLFAKLLSYSYSGVYATDIFDIIIELFTAIITASPNITASDVSKYKNLLSTLETTVERDALERNQQGQLVLNKNQQRVLNYLDRSIKKLNNLLVEIATAQELPGASRDKRLRAIASKYASEIEIRPRGRTVRVRVPREEAQGPRLTDFFLVPPEMRQRPTTTTTTTTTNTNIPPTNTNIGQEEEETNTNIGQNTGTTLGQIPADFDWRTYWRASPEEQQRMMDRVLRRR